MSLRDAINAKCKSCIYDPHAPGTWRQQVHACDNTGCPLHDVRPRAEKPLTRSALERYHNCVPDHVEVGDE